MVKQGAQRAQRGAEQRVDGPGGKRGAAGIACADPRPQGDATDTDAPRRTLKIAHGRAQRRAATRPALGWPVPGHEPPGHRTVVSRRPRSAGSAAVLELARSPAPGGRGAPTAAPPASGVGSGARQPPAGPPESIQHDQLHTRDLATIAGAHRHHRRHLAACEASDQSHACHGDGQPPHAGQCSQLRTPACAAVLGCDLRHTTPPRRGPHKRQRHRRDGPGIGLLTAGGQARHGPCQHPDSGGVCVHAHDRGQLWVAWPWLARRYAPVASEAAPASAAVHPSPCRRGQAAPAAARRLATHACHLPHCGPGLCGLPGLGGRPGLCPASDATRPQRLADTAVARVKHRDPATAWWPRPCGTRYLASRERTSGDRRSNRRDGATSRAASGPG